MECEENILVFIIICVIFKMLFNFKELLIIVVLKLLIENFLCNIVGLIKNMSVIVCWCMCGILYFD